MLNNIIYMYYLRIFNQTLGFIVVPVIASQFGPKAFGGYASAVAIVSYIILICDYGFDLNATRSISKNSKNIKLVSQIVSQTIFSKVTLLFLSSLVFIPYILIYKWENNVLLATYFSVIGQILFPTFAFQGMLANKYIAIIISVTKVTCFALIFYMIYCGDVDDITVYPILLGIFNLISFIFALIIIKRKLNVKFNLPSLNDILKELKKGFRYFLVKLGNGINASMTILIFTYFFSPTIVAYYAVSEKIQRVVDGLFLPLIQAIFPYFSKANLNEEVDKRRKYLFSIVFIFLFILSLMISVNSKYIIGGLFGNDYLDASNILSILAFAPPLSYLRNLITEVYLINLNLENEVKNNILYTTVFTFIYCLLSSSLYGYLIASSTILFSELFLILLSIFTFFRKKV